MSQGPACALHGCSSLEKAIHTEAAHGGGASVGHASVLRLTRLWISGPGNQEGLSCLTGAHGVGGGSIKAVEQGSHRQDLEGPYPGEGGRGASRLRSLPCCSRGPHERPPTQRGRELGSEETSAPLLRGIDLSWSPRAQGLREGAARAQPA